MAYRFGMEILVVYHGVIDKNVSGKSDWKMSKWNTTLWVFPAENFLEQRMGCYKRELLFRCEIAIFYTSLRPLRPFLVKGTELYKC